MHDLKQEYFMLNILDCDFYFDYYTSVDSVADCKSKCRLSCRQVQIKIFFLLKLNIFQMWSLFVQSEFKQSLLWSLLPLLLMFWSETSSWLLGQWSEGLKKWYLHKLHFKAFAFSQLWNIFSLCSLSKM